MSLIRVEGLSRTYHMVENMRLVQSRVLFNQLHLSIEKGEFVCVIGPSGSGKTTLLNIIGGLDSINDRARRKICDERGERMISLCEGAGRILIDGVDITRLKGNRKAEFMNRHIGFIFQFHHLIPELSALENVALPIRIAGRGQREALRRAMTQLQALEMEGNAMKKPAVLSSGEKQRVAIARALVNDPTIILADEPTGGLHSDMKEEIMQILIGLNQRGSTILMITHDVSLILDEAGSPRIGRLFNLKEHQRRETILHAPQNAGGS